MAGEYKEFDYVEAGTVKYKALPPLDASTNKIMKSEWRTGFSLTIFYAVLIFTIPILNWFAPEFAFKKVWGGMTITWFITGIFMMFVAFAIAFIHTALYEKRLQKQQSIQSDDQGGRPL
ncbi:MAG: DUF485 domain-containing protein [Bacillus sp. (in: firmicutes)]